MTTERPDRGARELAERINRAHVNVGNRGPSSPWTEADAQYVLLPSGAFLPDAAELERLRRIETAARALKSKPEQVVTDANALAALRAALEPEGSAQG